MKKALPGEMMEKVPEVACDVPKPSASSRIFLIEDNPGDVYLLGEALREHGIEFQLDVAEDGRQAIAAIEAWLKTPGSLPDLIVLDLNIPQHDGAELLRKIRLDKQLATTPVIVLTSSDSPKDRAAAARLGANLYLRKPSNLDEFLAIGARLKQYLAGSAPQHQNGTLCEPTHQPGEHFPHLREQENDQE